MKLTINRIPSVLLVCKANVCRSPFAAAVLKEDFAGINFLAEVQSAGTQAISGQDRCSSSTKAIDAKEISTQVSLNINEIELHSYDLILTASKAQRSDVLQLVPAARDKIFTIVEAAHQSRWLVKPGGALDVAYGKPVDPGLEEILVGIPPLPENVNERWKWLIGEMHQWRGLTQGVQLLDSGQDIPDPHESRRNIHAEVFLQIRESISGFTQNLEIVLSS